MINVDKILSTLNMFEKEKLDCRTITMGISLLDCAHSNGEIARQRMYDKITQKAENLVSVGESIEKEYGIPIIHKRISVTPMSIAAGSSTDDSYVEFAKMMDRAARETGVNFIGGFSALVQKGFTKGDRILIESIPEALKETEFVCSSVNVGSTKSGINMDAVKLMGETIVKTAELTADQDSIGCAKLVVFANAVEDNPFMAGAFHGVGEPDTVINVGVSGPGVVKVALEACKGQPFDVVADTIKKAAFKVTRMGMLVAQRSFQKTGHAFRYRRSFSGSDAGGGRQHRPECWKKSAWRSAALRAPPRPLAMLNDAVKKGGSNGVVARRRSVPVRSFRYRRTRA